MAAKRKRKSLSMPKPKAKGVGKQRGKGAVDEDSVPENYHFIAYLRFKGRLWELDGLKHGPLECAELEDPRTNWVDAIRPALSGRMAAYAAAGDVWFNLLALVKDNYQLRSDALELTRRELNALERRLTELFDRDWKIQVRVSLAIMWSKLPKRLARSMDPFYWRRTRSYSRWSPNNQEEGLMHELMRQAAHFSSCRWRICW